MPGENRCQNLGLRPCLWYVQVILQVTQEVRDATEDLQRDLDIQSALPGLTGFALNNCRKRYKKVAEHMGMIFKFHPGGNGQAMRALQQLETALGRHHHHLLVNGLAVSQNPAHTEHVLQQHHQHLLQLQQQGNTSIKVPELGEKGAAKRRRWLGGEPFQLWNFEAAYTRALDQWIVTSASELAAQVQRLLAGEEWHPLSQTQRVAGSAVELQRLLNVGVHIDGANRGVRAKTRIW
ncbi:hypothetical protein DUNSADRAFT_8503 [Dunaliella salina]|uniref:Uncharacterized protein n=1 Tax=Dunaliella salina TaxID=3046 RepID=A0ABQ7GJE1_DUNSA|nr:hypothetical protein DUNSADRAFT_8503 [Dunaliella salina]|eukprot:KAF5834733.1 hypothetical protein DUNSADRAFT_8503 [Dunaliella salina]